MKKQYNPLAGEMMTPHNSEVYMHLAMLELATLECEALGIEVEKVEWFDTGRPRLVARDNTTTRKMAQINVHLIMAQKLKTVPAVT
ncbi:hypothetical protein [Pasteurella multocida]|uniref:hypothetical protein n=1 Tax=Pasteurella multocida TaxID=747 RepID=UPI001D123C1B|nr:hypothetical protein [Pasteurella multocida]